MRICKVMLLLILVGSCQGEELGSAYDIIDIRTMAKEENIEGCFKSSLIIFDLEKNSVKMPGYEKFSNMGRFTQKKDSLLIGNLKECYFNGNYKLSFYTTQNRDFIFLENEHYVIRCSKIDFSKMVLSNGGLLDRALDKKSLNSDICVDFRAKKCLEYEN